MMKLSFSTLGCPEWSWDHIVEQAAQCGYDGIEIRGVAGEMYVPRIAPFSPERLASTMADLAKRGLEIVSLDTSVKFHLADRRDEFLREGIETIDLARRMGVPYIRIQGDAFPDPAAREQTMEAIVDGFRELCDHAEGSGVMNLIEVHGDFNRTEPLREALERTGSDALGILWDIEHTHKVYGSAWRDFYESLRGAIRHVHIKDIRMADIAPNGKPRHCLTGMGDIPIPSIVAALAEDGYDGYLSLEWEKKWNPWIEEPETAIPQYISSMKEILQTMPEQSETAGKERT
jgi:sugar phosphate isomerase/epimerase